MTHWSLMYDGAKATDIDVAEIKDDLAAFTIECWVKFDVLEECGVITKYGDNASNQAFQLYLDVDGELNYAAKNKSGDTVVVGPFKVEADAWYYVAAVIGEYGPINQIRLFVDGVLIDSGTWTGTLFPPTYDNVVLGARGDAFDGWYDYMTGKFAYVRISDSRRYHGTFTPPRAPHFLDSHTLRQYDMHEGPRHFPQDFDDTIDRVTGESLQPLYWNTDIPKDKWGPGYHRWGDQWTILIDGTDRTTLIPLKSIKITEESGRPGAATFTLIDAGNDVTLRSWMTVQLWQGGRLEFGGLIMGWDVSTVAEHRQCVVQCSDYSILLSARLTDADTYYTATAGEILEDLFTTKGFCTEITVRRSGVNYWFVDEGESLTVYGVDYDLLAAIVDELAQINSYQWRVRQMEWGTNPIHLMFYDPNLFETTPYMSPFTLSTTPTSEAGLLAGKWIAGSPTTLPAMPFRMTRWSVSGAQLRNYVKLIWSGGTSTTTREDTASQTLYGFQLEMKRTIDREINTASSELIGDGMLAFYAHERQNGGQALCWIEGAYPGMNMAVEHETLGLDDIYTIQKVSRRWLGPGKPEVTLDLGEALPRTGLADALGRASMKF